MDGKSHSFRSWKDGSVKGKNHQRNDRRLSLQERSQQNKHIRISSGDMVIECTVSGSCSDNPHDTNDELPLEWKESSSSSSLFFVKESSQRRRRESNHYPSSPRSPTVRSVVDEKTSILHCYPDDEIRRVTDSASPRTSMVSRTSFFIEPMIEMKEEGTVYFHYFWFSRFFIVLYSIIGMGIYSRRLWIIQMGIPFVILCCMVRNGILWLQFALHGGGQESKDAIKYFRWLYRLVMKHVRDAFDGDTLMAFCTVQCVTFWTFGGGKTFALSYTRAVSREIRRRSLEETQTYLDENTKLFDETHDLTDLE